MSMITTPLERALRWDEEESDSSHVTKLVNHIPHLATSSLAQGNTQPTRMSAFEKEVMALKEMLQNEFWKTRGATSSTPLGAPSDKFKTSQITPTHERSPVKA